MKIIVKIFCITMVMVMLAGCARGGYLAKETKGEDDKFNTETYDITYQLTKEQQESYASAGYEILCSVKGVGYMDESDDSRADDIYMFVYRGRNVEVDESGVLHGYYGKETLYGYNMTEDKYTTIPLIMMEEANQVENEICYTCPVVISNSGTEKNIREWKSESVDLKILFNEEYPNGIIRNVLSDESNEEYDLDKYSLISMATSARYFTRGKNEEMIDFFEWEEAGKLFGIELDLTEGYHLEMRPLDDPENFYCMFYIKDVDGNYSYSELIPIPQ